MYVVCGNISTYTFDTYREAEIFCGESHTYFFIAVSSINQNLLLV